MSQPNHFRAIIEAATRAPSGHNSQPWLFTINSEDHITLAPDFTRRLPAVDADNRELFISLGCATENLYLAAAHFGYTAQAHLADNHAIHITLHKQPETQKQPVKTKPYTPKSPTAKPTAPPTTVKPSPKPS